MKVSLHQFSYDIDIIVSCPSVWFNDVHELDDIFMLKELEQLDLSENPLGIHEVFEGVLDLLDGDLLILEGVVAWANDSVGTMANLFDAFVALIDHKLGASALEGVFAVDYLAGGLVEHALHVLVDWLQGLTVRSHNLTVTNIYLVKN